MQLWLSRKSLCRPGLKLRETVCVCLQSVEIKGACQYFQPPFTNFRAGYSLCNYSTGTSHRNLTFGRTCFISCIFYLSLISAISFRTFISTIGSNSRVRTTFEHISFVLFCNRFFPYLVRHRHFAEANYCGMLFSLALSDINSLMHCQHLVLQEHPHNSCYPLLSGCHFMRCTGSICSSSADSARLTVMFL